MSIEHRVEKLEKGLRVGKEPVFVLVILEGEVELSAEEKEKKLAELKREKPGEPMYVAFWKSGHWTNPPDYV